MGKEHEQMIVAIQNLESLEQKQVFVEDQSSACLDTMSEFIVLHIFVHQADYPGFFSWLLLAKVTQDAASHWLKQRGKKTGTQSPHLEPLNKEMCINGYSPLLSQLHRG